MAELKSGSKNRSLWATNFLGKKLLLLAVMAFALVTTRESEAMQCNVRLVRSVSKNMLRKIPLRFIEEHTQPLVFDGPGVKTTTIPYLMLNRASPSDRQVELRCQRYSIISNSAVAFTLHLVTFDENDAGEKLEFHHPAREYLGIAGGKRIYTLAEPYQMVITCGQGPTQVSHGSTLEQKAETPAASRIESSPELGALVPTSRASEGPSPESTPSHSSSNSSPYDVQLMSQGDSRAESHEIQHLLGSTFLKELSMDTQTDSRTMSTDEGKHSVEIANIPAGRAIPSFPSGSMSIGENASVELKTSLNSTFATHFAFGRWNGHYRCSTPGPRSISVNMTLVTRKEKNPRIHFRLGKRPGAVYPEIHMAPFLAPTGYIHAENSSTKMGTWSSTGGSRPVLKLEFFQGEELLVTLSSTGNGLYVRIVILLNEPDGRKSLNHESFECSLVQVLP